MTTHRPASTSTEAPNAKPKLTSLWRPRRGSLRVKSALKAGKIATNSNARPLKVKSAIKGGRIAANSNARPLKVKSAIKGGRIAMNHSARVR